MKKNREEKLPSGTADLTPKDLVDSSVQTVIYDGTISCKAVLENRPEDCRELIVSPNKKTRDIAYIISLAKRNEIPVSFQKKEAMKEKLGISAPVLLQAIPRKIPSLSQMNPSETGKNGLVAVLTGLEDPYNLGSSVRSLYAAGCSLLILYKRDWAFAAPVIVRSSAGAWEKIPVAMIEDDQELLDWKNANGLPLFAASRKEAVSLFEARLPENCILVIGGALRGVSTRLEEEAEQRIYIPYGRDFKNALDTPSAAAVMGFFWLEQNQKSGS